VTKKIEQEVTPYEPIQNEDEKPQKPKRHEGPTWNNDSYVANKDKAPRFQKIEKQAKEDLEKTMGLDFEEESMDAGDQAINLE